MNKTEIKAYFNYIRKSDLASVIRLVSKNPEYLSATNFAPPKKDDGQSGLQVAFKTGNFDIAKYLIQQGADVNFIEQSKINDWRAPVIHDCIRATIFNTETLQKDLKKFEQSYSILNLMLEKEANPNAKDSFGNNCLERVLLDARQMIKHPGFNPNKATLSQIRKVFKILIGHGADVKNVGLNGTIYKELKFFGLEEYKLISLYL